MADRKSDKWFWLAAGGGALLYLATRPSSDGMNGIGAAPASAEPLPSSISPDAIIPDSLSEGRPGNYVVTVRVVDVPLSDPLTRYLSTAPFQSALERSGIAGKVTRVEYLRNGPVSSANWAADVIDDIFSGGSGSGTKRAVSDLYFDVYLTLGPSSGGMGAVQIGAGAMLVIVGAIAIGIAAFFPSARAAIVEGAKALGAAAGAIIREPLTEAGKGILYLGLAAVAVIFLAKKSGARVTTSKFSF